MAKKSKGPISVRMYNVGFGDSFLLRIPGPGGSVLKVLIDCGSIAKASLSMTDVVGNIMNDITESDGVARLDVIVCTHRHADHVSGFADERWRDVEVQEVWFPWTENPKDAEAKRIRETQARIALALRNSWANVVAVTPIDADIKRRFELMAVNALSNDKAMTMLHGGIRSGPVFRYLVAEAAGGSVLESTALPGVKVTILGPSKSEAVIRDMDPPAGKTYLKRVLPDGNVERPFEPFGEEWGIEPAKFAWGALLVSDDDADAMRTASADADPAISVSLDKAVNGTSLVLVFELGDAVLFFPADAQWGTWKEILENEIACDLLRRASFLKVGHHGSHNATPKEFVQKIIRNGCCTMMSTKTGKWETIPRKPLVTALQKKTGAFARSDVVNAQLVAPFTASNTSYMDAEIAT